MSTSSSIPISVVINTRNAESTLQACLKSVSWASEIIVVDMKSTDTTVAIAEKAGATVFSHKQVDYVEPARNFALSKANLEWILLVDADEVIPKELATKLINLANGDASADAYYIPRKNILLNHAMAHTGWWPDYQMRFFKNGVVKWSDKIHTQPTIKGTTDKLPPQQAVAIEHRNYQSIEQFITRLNRYTTVEANNRKDQKSNLDTILLDVYGEFFNRFFVQKGYLDQAHGLIFSNMQAFYQLVAKAKQWQQSGAKFDAMSEESAISQQQQIIREWQFWIADWKVNRSFGLKKLYWQIQRKYHALRRKYQV